MSAEQNLTFAHLAIPLLGLLIPIVAIVAHYLTKAHAVRQRHETLREFARAGQPVPPELLVEPQGERDGAAPKDPQQRILQPAMVNLGLGLGVMGLFAAIRPGSWLWAIGLVPLGLGLGLLALWLVARKQPPTP
jgi:Domain of unknown function (DUF6249)